MPLFQPRVASFFGCETAASGKQIHRVRDDQNFSPCWGTGSTPKLYAVVIVTTSNAAEVKTLAITLGPLVNS